jgi:signal transduction histidine kinase
MAADGDAKDMRAALGAAAAASPAGERAAPTRSLAGALRCGKITAGYLALYLLLEWVSWVFANQGYAISPWNPPAGLSLALLLIFGVAYTPLILVGAILADLVIREAPVALAVTVLSGLAPTLVYAGSVWLLARRLAFGTKLASLRDLTLLVGAAIVPTAAVAAAFVGVYVGFGTLAEAAFADAFLRYWVGDAIGILVTAPLLLRLQDIRQYPVRPLEVAAQFVLLVGCIWLIAGGKLGDQLKLFHILFLPVVWLAVRQGLSGAATGCFIVQVGLILDAVHDNLEAGTVIELQVLMMTLAVTAMFTGILVDERRAQEEGREQMREQMRHLARLSLSGEIASGLAHELNQPLTALLNYVRVGRTQLERGDLNAAMGPIMKAEAQGMRAAETIQRLRGFLRGGQLALVEFELSAVVDETVQMLKSVAKAHDVVVRVSVEPPGARVLADRVHVMQILANLLSNAFDAVATAGAVPGYVDIIARRLADGVEISVYDSGPGVPAEARDRIFDSFFTTKDQGMGLGLAISRSLVEAQGGTIRYEPSSAASAGRHRFVFTLVSPAA